MKTTIAILLLGLVALASARPHLESLESGEERPSRPPRPQGPPRPHRPEGHPHHDFELLPHPGHPRPPRPERPHRPEGLPEHDFEILPHPGNRPPRPERPPRPHQPQTIPEEYQTPERPQILPYPPRPHPDEPRPEMPIGELPEELVTFIHDIKDFFNLYPRKEIRRIVREHWHDEELKAVMHFIRTSHFREIVHTIVESEEFQNIGEYLKNANWPWIHKVLDDMTEEIEVMGRSLIMSKSAGGGLNGLLDDIIAVLPKEELRALFEEKMENSPVFAAVVNIFTSEEMSDLLTAVKNSDLINSQFEILHENGIDVSKLFEYQRSLFGF